MSYGKDFYRNIEAKGFKYGYEYLGENPIKCNVKDIMMMDIQKAILEIATDQGMADMLFDARLSQDRVVQKSLFEAGFGTILTDPELNKVIGNLVEFRNPLIANMRKEAGVGHQAQVLRRTVGTAASWVADTDSLVEGTGYYAQVTFDYKTLGTQGKLTRKMIAIGRSVGDILANEITRKTIEFRDKLDYTIIKGNKSTAPNEPDGLDILIPSTQRIAMTAGLGGASLTKAKMDEFIDKSTGNPSFIIVSKAGSRVINSLVQTYQRFNDSILVRGGMRVPTWDDYPIFKSTNLTDVEVWNDTAFSAYTGGSETHFIAVDNDEVWLEFLTPIQVMPLARVSSQYLEFDIFCDMTIPMRNYQTCAALVGILP